jgi:hypothetical protein
VIDRKTALQCAGLIALMSIAGAWQLLMLDDWTTIPVGNGASLSSLLLFVFPASSALVAGSLYWNGRRPRADEAKVQAWRKWGRFFSLSYCGGLLAMQGVLVVRTLGLDVPFDLSAMARALAVLLSIVSLLAINQMPKLPWLESRAKVGGDLGPIYGPRFMRTQSRVLVVFLIAVVVYNVAAPPVTAWRSTAFILLAAALLVVWSVAWRFHLGRKWKIEQSAARGMTPP